MAVKTCIVSYWDTTCRYSIEVVAESLYEAVVLGIKAMKLDRSKLHLLNFDIAVKEPEVHHSISGAMLSAWLAHPGKSPKDQALKQRLDALLRG